MPAGKARGARGGEAFPETEQSRDEVHGNPASSPGFQPVLSLSALVLFALAFIEPTAPYTFVANRGLQPSPFELLHGLGFAGGLNAAGLPTGHIPLALALSSAGVEVGHFRS